MYDRSDKVICKKCGKENNNGEKYCGNCGEALYEVNKKNDSNSKLLIILLILILVIVLGLIIIKIINFNSNDGSEENVNNSNEINSTEEKDNNSSSELKELSIDLTSNNKQKYYELNDDFNLKIENIDDTGSLLYVNGVSVGNFYIGVDLKIIGKTLFLKNYTGNIRSSHLLFIDVNGNIYNDIYDFGISMIFDGTKKLSFDNNILSIKANRLDHGITVYLPLESITNSGCDNSKKIDSLNEILEKNNITKDYPIESTYQYKLESDGKFYYSNVTIDVTIENEYQKLLEQSSGICFGQS